MGVFELVADPLNYSNAMIACEDAGGHLANVVSDSRTSFLASLVSTLSFNQTVSVHKAFVGLFFENEFVTITGKQWRIRRGRSRRRIDRLPTLEQGPIQKKSILRWRSWGSILSSEKNCFLIIK